MLLFAHCISKEEPGFAVVDTETGVSAYAERCSIWDSRSWREPEKVAREMIAAEAEKRHDIPHIAWADRRRLGILKAANLLGSCGSCERDH